MKLEIEKASNGYIITLPAENEEHIEQKIADTSKPIIQAEIKIGKFEIIDGNHRFEKDLREGKKTIN